MARRARQRKGEPGRELEPAALHRVEGGRVSRPALSSELRDTPAELREMPAELRETTGGEAGRRAENPGSESDPSTAAGISTADTEIESAIETTEATAPDADRAPVLLVGFGTGETEDLRRELAACGTTPSPVVLASPGTDQALELLHRQPVAVLCLGAGLDTEAALRLLRVAPAPAPRYRRQDVLLAAGGDLGVFQDLVDAERVFYLSRRPPPPADSAAIVASAVERYRGRDLLDAGESHQDWALGARSIFELAGRLAMESRLERAARATAREAAELVGADSADCRIHDPADETLWRAPAEPRPDGPGRGEAEERDSTAAGVSGFVARTGRAVKLTRLGADPRYEPDADNDSACPDERFLAVPIGAAGQVLAVISARRSAEHPTFSEAELRRLELLARQVAPVFGRLVLERQLRDRSFGAPGVFRHQAVEQHLAGFGDRGKPLQVSPAWSHWVFRLLVMVFVVALIFAAVGSIHEYAEGPAIVRLGDRLDITATLAGTVGRAPVAVGQEVAAGELLVAFHQENEAAELARIHHEWELGLVQRMLHPADPGIGRSLSSLRAQKQLAESRLEARAVRAPRAGVVGDLRVRPGQHLVPGQVVATLVAGPGAGSPRPAGENAVEPGRGAHILAFFPGHYRPLLGPGQPLRLELEGYRYAYQHLTIDSVAGEVLGPTEARRILGAGLDDAIPVGGPVVWVKARLASAEFESEGRLYPYHDGVQGRAEVRVRRERLFTTLFPGLKRFFGGSDG
ncbi:MAG: GAF domain-containing protein [Holophagales bacterium]|nr:GAF domain-containing protein [Holophagales bacterium]